MKYTHTHLTALFPGLPGWAGTRKVKPIWILLEQETVSGSGISRAICKSAPRSRQITTPAPHHSSFLQAGCPSCHPTNSIKALKATNEVHQLATSLTAMGTHMPCGITQCYLPPDRGDIPALTSAEAGTRFSNQGGMQGWGLDLVGWLHTDIVHLPEDDRGSPIPVITGPDVPHAPNDANHYAMPPLVL